MTASNETVRLSPFAKRHRLAPLPGTPEGRTFGYVSNGMRMPAEGACYVVEFLEGAAVRVCGYVDKFGRAFSVDGVQTMPPAKLPAITLSLYTDRSDESGCICTIDSDGTEHRIGEFRQRNKKYDLFNLRVRIGDACEGLSYDELFATLHLACCVFPKECGVELNPFGPAEVYNALAGADVFAAVKQIVSREDAVEAHPLQMPSGVVSYFVRTLRSHRVDDIDPYDLPRRMPGRELEPGVPGSIDVRLARTRSYANAFYVGFDQDAVTPEGRSRLLCLESVLNRFWLVSEALSAEDRLTSASDRECAALERSLVAAIAQQAPEVGLEPDEPDGAESEWDVRVEFCRTCERFRLPYRLSYRLRVNLEASTMGIEAACPPSDLMPAVEWSEEHGAWIERRDEDRFADEAAYAENIARLIMAAAFSTARTVTTVSIDVVRDLTTRDRVISGIVHRASFVRALEQADATVPGSFCEACGLVRAANVYGRLETVDQARALDDPVVCPASRYRSPETDERPIVHDKGVLWGIERIENMAINEGGERAKFAEEVALAYRERGTEGALQALKDIHDRSEDLTVRSVCTKVEMALDDGVLGEDPARTIADLFSDAWGLRTLSVQANAIAQNDAQAARSLLDEIVLLSQANGSFEDTESVRWRYFDCYASRAVFAFEDGKAIEARDDGSRDERAVRPLPDEIFAAHHGIATLLHDSFEENEVALEHAKTCIALAPSTAAGYFTLARAYFFAGDYASEIETLKQALRIVWNPSDAALALYWLAYAHWRSGDPALGASCYLQAMGRDASIRDIAARELDELLKENPGLRYPGIEGSEASLEQAGIALSCVEANARRLMEAARVMADNGNFVLAATLLTASLRTIRDDAMYPVLESFSHPERP